MTITAKKIIEIQSSIVLELKHVNLSYLNTSI